MVHFRSCLIVVQNKETNMSLTKQNINSKFCHQLPTQITPVNKPYHSKLLQKLPPLKETKDQLDQPINHQKLLIKCIHTRVLGTN